MTNKSTHLRFLLALGNTRIVVLNQDENLHIYHTPQAKEQTAASVQAEHISEALVTK
ncbi:MAG: hypothetical protein IJ266_03550 [Elusimicrobiaceae bacterium]|nr:hypothetical protein [Elusimicrobiaceae bacterium]